jgi:PAS domain S-box-containing protein
VPLWEEDISKLRARLAVLKKNGGFCMRDYLSARPQFAQEAVRLIKVTDVNQASLRLFEAERKEQLLGPLDMVLGAVLRTAVTETLLAIDEGRNDVETESTALTLKGNTLFLLVKTHIPPEGASYPSMLVSLIDITARKRAVEKEQQSANILHNIIESLPDMIFVKDSSLRMVLCNSTFAHATGREPQETYGKTDIENGWSPDLVKGNPEKGIAGWEKDDLAVLSGKTVHSPEEPAEVNKSSRYFDTTKFPLRDSRGIVIGVIGVARDVTEQRKNQAALRASETSYRGLIQQAADGIIEIERNGRFIGANTAFCDMLGCEREELEGLTILDTYPEYAREAGSQRMSAITPGVVMRFARPMKRRDGSLIQVEVSMRLLENGMLVGILHDITKRMQYEAALAYERSLFSMLMDHLPDSIYFKDKEGRFLRTSRSHAADRGLSEPDEETGKTDADFSTPEHALKAHDDEERIIGTGIPMVDVEELVTYKDRPPAWFVSTKMPLRDAAGSIVGTFGISHNVTASRELAEKNQQLATLVESAEDAIVGLDLERRITVWNRGAERLYWYTAEEMLGRTTAALIPSDLEEEARIIRDRIQRGEQIAHFETARLRKDGARIIVSLTLAAVRDANGMIVGMASVARDITAEKALQAQLSRTQRLESLATLAGGVAHQFNNLNTVVQGYLELLKTDRGLSPRLLPYVDAAYASVQREVAITARLLTLTEPGGSSDTLRLDELAHAQCLLHEKRLEEEKVSLHLDLEETPPVECNEQRLRFVFSSLMGNAIDSLLDQPVRRVSVRTGCTESAAWFEVEDSGCGISAEDMPRLFSPFFSGKGEWAPSGSPQARLRGVGLSLAISSATISEYGGKIDVHSTPGTGSTFRVEMPIRHQLA